MHNTTILWLTFFFEQAAGAFLFVTAMLGWYLLANQVLASTGFPFSLPVGDFTRFWEKKQVREVATEAETHEA